MNENFTKTNSMAARALWPSIMAVVLLIVTAWIFVSWTINLVYVPAGKSLLLTYKGAPLPFLPGYFLSNSEPGEFAKVDESGNPEQKGVIENMKGPGRHFYSPIWWDREIVDDVVVKPREVGIVTSKIGKSAPAGVILVEGDLGKTEFKGTLRKTLGPGIYRINPYGYDVKVISTETVQSGGQTKHAGWVEIAPGFVGVVTNQVTDTSRGMKTGLQNETIPPGNYPINPREQQIDIVNIGFRELTLAANFKADNEGRFLFDDAGEPIILNDGSGITFPDRYGFPVHMDFTTVWGITPQQAAEVIGEYGNVDSVQTKVIMPKVASICRNMGSKLSSAEFLVGDTRQDFQQDVSDQFQKELKEIDITLLMGLVRNIHIEQSIREPIQKAFISEEKNLTRQQEEKTSATETLLRRATAEVMTEVKTVAADTERMVRTKMAEAEKESQEIAAKTLQEVAAIDKEVAKLESEALVVLGEASAESRKLMEQAKAEKFKLAVEAFGSPQAYNKWVFANGLPDDMELNLFYAGEGTFWTDLKGFTETMIGKQQMQPTQPVKK